MWLADIVSSMDFGMRVTASLVVVLFSLLLLLRQRILNRERNLAHLPAVLRDSWLRGSHERFFSQGAKSMSLVSETSRKFDYKPWVVPGGLFLSPYVVVPSVKGGKKLLGENTSKGGAPIGLYYPGTPMTIVTAEGHDWRVRRDTINPAFAHGNLIAAVPALDKVAQEAVGVISERVRLGQSEMDVHDIMSRVALEVAGYAAYGDGFGAVRDQSNRAHWAAHQLSLLSLKNFTNPIRRLLCIGYKEFEAAGSVLDQVAKDQLAKCSTKQNLLTLIRNAVDPTTGTKIWSDAQFFEELRLIVNAAHDPALPMSFALLEVARHPEVAKKAMEELDRVVGDSDTIEASHLVKLDYIGGIFREALRLYPVSGVGSVRRVERDVDIDGVKVPKGVFGIVPFYTAMRCEQTWSDPECFKPERFLQAKARNDVNLVFSAGERMCVGFELALYQGTMVLAHLLRKFTFTTIAEKDVELQCGIHIMPKDVWLKCTPVV